MYYRDDLAFVHDRGFGGHADVCAPGVLDLLEPVLARSGLVLELGCGSGALTRHLVRAGHRVIATDGSEAMLRLARDAVPAATIERLVLPDDPVPEADAVVSVGHVLNYLDTEDQLRRALAASADSLRPGGVLVLDLCDLAWGDRRVDAPPHTRIGDDWAIITEFEVPTRDKFVRHISTFVRTGEGTWRRDDETHENVLVDTSVIPELMAQHGMDAEIRAAFGSETLPDGLVVLFGTKR